MKPIRILLFVISICFASSLAAQTVYTTKTGEKYHKANCRYLKYSKKERELKDAISLGYEACLVYKSSQIITKSSQSNIRSNSLSKSKSSSRSIGSTSLQNKSSKKSISSQCTGKTKSGSRCKRKTKSVSGRCYQH